jgi:hypothetical protein
LGRDRADGANERESGDRNLVAHGVDLAKSVGVFIPLPIFKKPVVDLKYSTLPRGGRSPKHLGPLL